MTEQERKAFERWASDDWTSPLVALKDSDGIYKLMSVQQQWRAWQARAALAAKVPTGYKLVPVEPTEEMLQEVHMQVESHSFDNEFLYEVWDAMLAATPAPAPEASIARLVLRDDGRADLEWRRSAPAPEAEEAVWRCAPDARYCASCDVCKAPPAQAQQAADWRKPTTYRERFAQAVALLCGKRAPDDMIDGWLERDADTEDDRLQGFASEHGPSWAQGIVMLDAAHVMSDTPTEGVEHGERASPPQAQQAEPHQPGETNGRNDGPRPTLHGRVAVGGYTPGALADLLFASRDVMALNADLGLKMDQIVALAQAVLTATKAKPEAQPLTDERIESATAHIHMNAPLARWVIAREVEKVCASAWGVKLGASGETK